MRTADPSDPLEWVALLALIVAGIAPAALLTSTQAEAALYGVAMCVVVWSTVALIAGPRKLLARVRSVSPDRQTQAVEETATPDPDQ